MGFGKNKGPSLNFNDFIIPTILFIGIGICFNYIMKEDKRRKESTIVKKEKAGISDMELINQGNAFIWQGIRGESPKFISSKGMKGLGWGEFPVYFIKDKLKHDYGQRIIEEYVSPSRMEYEFRSAKRPVCTYPYEWKDPAKLFAKNPPFLISVGLDYSGDRDLKIIFSKENRYKFIKHLDNKGMINVRSLLNDKTLKGILLNDADLGEVSQILIARDSQGNPSIKKEFLKNIKLLVTNNNVQLLKMLKGQRMDYTFEQFITTHHYKNAQLPPSDFDTISYYKESVKSVKDNNLITHSVRCNKHPYSYKIIPVINEMILTMRGQKYKLRTESHREKIEEGYKFKLLTYETIIGRYKAELGSMEIDWWVKEFNIDYLKNSSLAPLKLIANTQLDQKQNSLVKNNSRKSRLWYYENSTRLVLLAQGDIESAKQNKYLATFPMFFIDNSGKNELALHLLDLDQDIIKLGTPELIDPMNITLKNGIKSLTLSAAALSDIELKKILENHTKLEELHILYPNSNISSIIIESIPPKLKALSIVRADLRGKNLSSKLHGLKLERLNLTATKLDNGQLKAILKDHHTNLKHLNLSFQKNVFTDDFSKFYSNLNWPNLKELHLRGSIIFGSHIKNIIKTLGENITSLRLEGNYLDPNDFKNIFLQCPNLLHLVANDSPLKLGDEKIILPGRLTTLVLRDSSIKKSDLQSIIFPNTLKTLDLSNNPINDIDLEYLGKILPVGLENLHLSRLSNTSQGAINLFFDLKKRPRPWIKGLRILNIQSMKVNDFALESLQKSSIVDLNIDDNKLTNESVKTIESLKELKNLHISSNFFTQAGLDELYKSKSYKNLSALSINSAMSIDGRKLALNIPNQLKSLSILGNAFNQDTMQIIFQKLPKTLTSLSIEENSINKNCIYEFISNMPRNLAGLYMNGVFNDQQAFIDLLNSLPNSVTHLSITTGQFSQNINLDQQFISYPRELDTLRFTPNSWSSEFSHKVLSTFPASLDNYWFVGSKLDKIATDILSKHSFVSVNSLGNLDEKSTIPLGDIFIGSYKITHEQILSIFQKGPNTIYAKVMNPPKFGFSKKLPKNLSNSKNLNFIAMLGSGMTDQAALEYTQYDLSNVYRLQIDDTALTAKGIIEFLKAISKEALLLSIQSSSMTLEGVDSVIRALPPNIRELKISGSKIGEIGYQKFRDWKIRQEERLGYEIELVE